MLKKLKSLFIIEDENAAKDIGKAPTKPSSKSTPVKSNSTKSSAPKEVQAGKPQEKFVNILLEAVEKNNLEGFDYLEYKQSLQSLNKMNMDEETKYKSAFAMASTMGIDKAKLVKSVNHYLAVLKNEEAKFNKALSNQINKKVGQRKTELTTLHDTITHKEKQIEKLTKEIAQHKAELKAINEEINNAASKVEGTKSSFYGSYQVVSSQIEEDLKKINQYL